MKLNVIILIAVYMLMVGCSVIHRGLSTKVLLSPGWEVEVRTYKNSPDDKFPYLKCGKQEMQPSIRRLNYAAWVGPPLIPFIPGPVPSDQVAFSLGFSPPYDRGKSATNNSKGIPRQAAKQCPTLIDYKGNKVKAYRNHWDCDYGLYIPRHDFILKFSEEEGDMCKIPDLKIHVEPTWNYTPLWLFRG
jgi:hypothetical protein